MLGPRACSRDVVEPGFKHRLSDLEPCSYTHSVLCRVLRDADSMWQSRASAMPPTPCSLRRRGQHAGKLEGTSMRHPWASSGGASGLSSPVVVPAMGAVMARIASEPGTNH